MAFDILKGQNSRDFARGQPPPRGSWEYAGVGSMWEAGAVMKTNLKHAIEVMQGRYRTLSRQGAFIQKVLLTGKKVPPETTLAYHKAVADYLRYGSEVFDDLDKRKFGVEQVVLRDGQPVPDPRNPLGVRTLKISTPLQPITFPGFAAVNEATKAAAKAAVTGDDEMGFVIAPLLVPLAPFMIKGGLLIMGLTIGGYVSLKALEKIIVLFHGPKVDIGQEADKQVEALKKLMKAGYTEKEAKEELEKQRRRQEKEEEKGIKWWQILLGGAGVGGAIWFFGRRK